jgi:hypothetical protein
LGPGDDKAAAGLGKFNPNHDERGRFATAENAVGAVGIATRKPRAKGTQVASLDTVSSDVGGADTVAEVAQIIEPEPFEPPRPMPPEATQRGPSARGAPTGTVAEAVAPNGELPGVAAKLGDPRTMPASDDPKSSARVYALKAYNGQVPVSLDRLDEDGGFVAQMPDGAIITFRPAGQASWRTESSTANVDIKDDRLIELNAGKILKLKFPKR